MLADTVAGLARGTAPGPDGAPRGARPPVRPDRRHARAARRVGRRPPSARLRRRPAHDPAGRQRPRADRAPSGPSSELDERWASARGTTSAVCRSTRDAAAEALEVARRNASEAEAGPAERIRLIGRAHRRARPARRAAPAAAGGAGRTSSRPPRPPPLAEPRSRRPPSTSAPATRRRRSSARSWPAGSIRPDSGSTPSRSPDAEAAAAELARVEAEVRAERATEEPSDEARAGRRGTAGRAPRPRRRRASRSWRSAWRPSVPPRSTRCPTRWSTCARAMTGSWSRRRRPRRSPTSIAALDDDLAATVGDRGDPRGPGGRARPTRRRARRAAGGGAGRQEPGAGSRGGRSPRARPCRAARRPRQGGRALRGRPGAASGREHPGRRAGSARRARVRVVLRLHDGVLAPERGSRRRRPPSMRRAPSCRRPRTSGRSSRPRRMPSSLGPSGWSGAACSSWRPAPSSVARCRAATAVEELRALRVPAHAPDRAGGGAAAQPRPCRHRHRRRAARRATS